MEEYNAEPLALNPYSVEFWNRCFLPMIKPRRGKLMTPCLEWTGIKTPRGHGVLPMPEGETLYTHRYVLEMCGVYVGDAYACHLCDNPACCNPIHLYLGDAQSNARDRKDRGMNRLGRKHAYRPFYGKEVIFNGYPVIAS